MAEDYRTYINMSTMYFLRCAVSKTIPQRGEAAYKEFTSLADQFQNVDATPYPDLEHSDEESVRYNLAS